MSNASLKEQLQAVASELSETLSIKNSGSREQVAGRHNEQVAGRHESAVRHGEHAKAMRAKSSSEGQALERRSDNVKSREHHSNQRPQTQANSKRSPASSGSEASASRTPKPKWLDYAQYGVELLKVYFPESFKSAREIKPLKKGIKQDLVKSLSQIATIVTDDKACMVKSLAFYVNTAAYHKCVVVGAARIDLEGKEAGVVTQEEATYSLERYKIKMDAKQVSTTNRTPNKN